MSKQKDASKETALAEPAQSAVALPTESFSGFAGQGFEGTTRDDFAIPFLQILQSNSPEVKRSEGAYIEGAQEGMLLNTVTKEVFDTAKTEVVLIPCWYQRTFVEWRLRENGGGFVAEHKPGPKVDAMLAHATRDEKGRDILDSGNQLNDTRTFYVMMVRDGVPTPAVLAMTSTQIKKAKQWMMQQNLLKLPAADGTVYTPPMFAGKWVAHTVPESNERGSWMGWMFSFKGYCDGPADPVFVAALSFHKSLASGAIKADMSRADTSAGMRDREPGEDDDIPL